MTSNRSTNFFARQDRARKNCRKQLVLFVFAVTIIVLVTTLAIRLVWYIHIGSGAYASFSAAEAQTYERKLAAFSFLDPASFLFVAMAIVIVILAASVYKMSTLQKGGSAVAEMLGGREIGAGTTDPAERRLINVVEEMAIASGIPVPHIFVLDAEASINAFAAGLEISDAAVTVTRGALNQLNRDELQGVIAHEFSHILNGDMRLNVQLIGILYGILFLGIAGRKFLAHGKYSLRAGIPALALGLFLTLIGSVGSFLGRIMQCGITRQQEFLADASAVQFTRNPLGLAGALKKIGGSSFGSRIQSPAARQASHLFFGESHPEGWFGFLTTHPPLAVRIRLLDPSFDGTFVPVRYEQPIREPRAAPFATLNIPVGSPQASRAAAEAVDRVGNPTWKHLEKSQTFLSSLPSDIHQSLRTTAGAASLIYALLLDPEESRRNVQMATLSRALVLQGHPADVFKVCTPLSGLKREQRLPLIELAMPALSGLTSMEKRNFLLILNALVNADGQVSLFELSVQWILNNYLNSSDELFRSITFFSYAQVGSSIALVLAALASAGNAGDPEKSQEAFQTGVSRIPELAARKPSFICDESPSYLKVANALTRLGQASFKIKESVIDACAHCAFADQQVTPEESELLHVVALALHCPLPPFIREAPATDAA